MLTTISLNAISQSSTNQAQNCLTSVIDGEPVAVQSLDATVPNIHSSQCCSFLLTFCHFLKLSPKQQFFLTVRQPSAGLSVFWSDCWPPIHRPLAAAAKTRYVPLARTRVTAKVDSRGGPRGTRDPKYKLNRSSFVHCTAPC